MLNHQISKKFKINTFLLNHTNVRRIRIIAVGVCKVKCFSFTFLTVWHNLSMDWVTTCPTSQRATKEGSYGLSRRRRNRNMVIILLVQEASTSNSQWTCRVMSTLIKLVGPVIQHLLSFLLTYFNGHAMADVYPDCRTRHQMQQWFAISHPIPLQTKLYMNPQPL